MIQKEIKWLSAPFRNAYLKYKQATTGITSKKERWKTCVASTFKSFDDVISAAYVNERHAQLAGPKRMVGEIG